MDYFIDSEPKIILMFVAYHGKESFCFTKEEVLKIATMPARKVNSENKLSLDNDSFFAIRDINKFQYYYKSGGGSRSSTAEYYFPNIAKKIFKVLHELDYVNSDEDYPIINITEEDYINYDPI